MKFPSSSVIPLVILALSSITFGEVIESNILVTAISGEVRSQQPNRGQWRTVMKGDTLLRGWALSVAPTASATLDLGKGVTLSLSGTASITFDKCECNAAINGCQWMMTASQATLIMDAAPALAQPSRLIVATPSAQAAIHGKQVQLIAEENMTVIDVMDGEVKVLPKSKKDESVLISGQRGFLSAPDFVLVKTTLDGTPISDSASAKPAGDTQSSGMPAVPTPAVPKADSNVIKPAVYALQFTSTDLKKSQLTSLTTYATNQLRSSGLWTVMEQKEVETLLRQNNHLDLLACRNDTCLQEFGHILNLDLLLLGEISAIGTRFIFNARLIDACNAKTLGTISETVIGDVGEFVDKMPELLNILAASRDTGSCKKSATASEPEAAAPPQKSGDAASAPSSTPPKNMVRIPAGTFLMGSPDKQGNADEHPQHTVIIDDFYMDVNEVTRDEFKKVMGRDPSQFTICPSCPVTDVTWNDAFVYCAKMGKRLPTEAEWEYACRSGTTTPYSYGNVLTASQANYNHGDKSATYHNRPIPVGRSPANAWKLYDMHGNAKEWCSDWYSAEFYGTSRQENPIGPVGGQLKVSRGGSWNSSGDALRSAARQGSKADQGLNNVGFRCAKSK